MLYMLLEQAVFGALAAVTLTAGLGVVLARRVWHATLSLGVALVSVAAHYVMLSAGFPAVVQVVVYVGGVVVLLAVAVMLTDRGPPTDGDTGQPAPTWPTVVALDRRLLPGLAAVGLCGVVGWVSLAAALPPAAGLPEGGLVADTGYALLGLPDRARAQTEGFLVAFVLIALVLDAALDGALALGKRDQTRSEE